MITDAQLRRESAERMACAGISTEALEAGAVAELVAAAEGAIEHLTAAQGEWSGVALPYAPVWTSSLKVVIENLRAALAKLEVKE